MLLQFVVMFVLIAPLNCLIEAWALSTIWRWLCTQSLGPGPSMAAWYGISVALTIIIHSALIDVQREKKSKKSDVDYAPNDYSMLMKDMHTSVGVTLGILMLLGTTWLSGKILGWL